MDFLCIHPFRDGNGRVSRLLTLAALYRHGYEVGKYVSIERIIEQSKETYYEVLQKSSLHWHEGKNDIDPWLHYFLGTIHSAYKEFAQRAQNATSPRGSKTELVIQSIHRQIGEFSMTDIEHECPSISRDMIRMVFRRLQKEKTIKCLGKGKSARWTQIG